MRALSAPAVLLQNGPFFLPAKQPYPIPVSSLLRFTLKIPKNRLSGDFFTLQIAKRL
jgi:hypothetical protein